MNRRESLKRRMEHSYNTKDSGGGTRPNAFNWNKVKDIKFYKPKLGKNRINIISYIVKTKNDPLVFSKNSAIGDEAYMLEVLEHTFIGPTKADVVCLKQFGKKCPICDQAKEFQDAGKKDSAGDLWPSRFCYYNVVDMDNPEDGVQVLGIKFNKFEKPLITASRAASDEDNGLIDFSDNENGYLITFWGENVTKTIKNKSSTYLEFSNFVFKERKEKLEKEWIKNVISFDELMIILTSEEVEKILYGENEASEDEEEDDDEDEKPAKRKSDDDDDDDEDDDDVEEEIEEEEEPPKPKKGEAKPDPKDEPEDDDDDENDCPHDHVYGKDCNKFPQHCDECDEYDACLKEQKRLKKVSK